MAERNFNSYHTSSALSAQPRVQVESQEENKILNKSIFPPRLMLPTHCLLGSFPPPWKRILWFEHIFILWQKYSTAVGDMFSSCKVWLLQLTLWLVQHLQTLPRHYNTLATLWQPIMYDLLLAEHYSHQEGWGCYNSANCQQSGIIWK